MDCGCRRFKRTHLQELCVQDLQPSDTADEALNHSMIQFFTSGRGQHFPSPNDVRLVVRADAPAVAPHRIKVDRDNTVYVEHIGAHISSVTLPLSEFEYVHRSRSLVMGPSDGGIVPFPSTLSISSRRNSPSSVGIVLESGLKSKNSSVSIASRPRSVGIGTPTSPRLPQVQRLEFRKVSRIGSAARTAPTGNPAGAAASIAPAFRAGVGSPPRSMVLLSNRIPVTRESRPGSVGTGPLTLLPVRHDQRREHEQSTKVSGERPTQVQSINDLEPLDGREHSNLEGDGTPPAGIVELKGSKVGQPASFRREAQYVRVVRYGKLLQARDVADL